MKTYLRIRLATRLIVVCALIFERPKLWLVLVPSEARPTTTKKAKAGQNNKEEMKQIIDSGASA